MKTHLVTVVAGVLAVGVWGNAQTHAAWVLLDNFDSYSTGQTTVVTGGVWHAEFSDPVGDPNDHTGNSAIVASDMGNSLQAIGGTAWRGAERDLTGTGAAVVVDEVQTYFWQVQVHSDQVTTEWVYDFMMGLAPSIDSIDITDAWQDFSVMPYINNAPDTPYINADGPGTFWALMSPDVWTNVWVVIDNDAVDPTFDLYYSTGFDAPVLVIAGANWRNHAANLDLNAIGFMAAGWDQTDYLIDNIYYTVGEDTTNPLAGAPDCVYLTVGGDGAGQSSFDNDSSNNWVDGLDPSAGKDYCVDVASLRSPADAANHAFQGDSLTVYTGGELLSQATGPRTLTANWTLVGGLIRNGAAAEETLAGSMEIIGDAEIDADLGPYVVSADVSGTGMLFLSGDGITFAGASTLTGDVVADGLGLVWDSGSSWTFDINASGNNNQIAGIGAATFNGTFVFDLTDAAAAYGSSWIITDVATQTFGGSFAVADFTESSPGVWTNVDGYQFDEATGVLSYGAPLDCIRLSAGGDSLGFSSFDNDGDNNWVDGLDPSVGKDYCVDVQFLRSPPDAVDYVFAGDTLTLLTGGALISKHSGPRTLTANWIMAGGFIRSGSGGDLVETIAGTMEILADGGEILADQTPYVVSASVFGPGTLDVNGGFTVTFTGDTTFDIGAAGENNQIAGTGTAVFDGTFIFDLTAATSNPGDFWQIVDVGTQSFDVNFSVNGFTEGSPGVWTSVAGYRFSEETGVLSYGAPPGYWDGDVSDIWSLAANWSADTLPAFTGFATTLNFADPGAAGGTLNNDVVGVELAGIRFTGNAAAFVLDGNAVSISADVVNNSLSTQELAFDIDATGNLVVDANEPVVISGVLSGSAGLAKQGDGSLTLSNPANTLAGDITFADDGYIILTASGALGDPNSTVILSSSFSPDPLPGDFSSLVFDGGVTQTKNYHVNTRDAGEGPQFMALSGINTMEGAMVNEAGGDRIIFEVAAGATLNVNTSIDSAIGLGNDRLVCIGAGTINFNGPITDYVDQTLTFNRYDTGVTNIVGPKSYTGATWCDSGVIAFVDPNSSNNVPDSYILQAADPNATLDFSGLMGGGIVLSGTQTLAGGGVFIGSVTTSSGSSLSPGWLAVDDVGVMVLDDLTLAGGTTIDIDLDPTTSDSIELDAGGMLVGPASGTVDIQVDIAAGFSAGDYVLMDWSAGSASGVELADFTTDFGQLSIVGSQLVLTIDLESRAKLLVSDTGNHRIMQYDVTQYGVLVPDDVQPVFAEGIVGLFELLLPVGLAKDSAGNVYVAEGDPANYDRVMKLDSAGNHIETIAEVNAINPSVDISGTPGYLLVDPTDSYLYVSVEQPNSVALDTTLEDVIYRIDLSGATSPVVYIDTTDVSGNYVLEDPRGLAFGPDGYLYVSTNDTTLDPNITPDIGSRVLRFDASGATGVYAGTLTTEHRDIKGMHYDPYLERLIVSLNGQNDIWAYTDLTQDFVANDPANGAFESIFEQDADEDYMDVAFAAGEIYFTDSTGDVIRQVTGPTSSAVVMGAAAGLLDPHSLLVTAETDPFDFDNDGDVDAADLAVMLDALSGADVTVPPVGVDVDVFGRADIDNDGDVDMKDVWAFQRRFTN
jgi:autotransporter-associated beta strand protein